MYFNVEKSVFFNAIKLRKFVKSSSGVVVVVTVVEFLWHLFFYTRGRKGWRSSESTRLPPVWLEFISRRRRHMWVEFVVSSLLRSERFFSGYSGFPLSSKTNISKFQFDQESGRRRTTLWMCYLHIVIYSFIYLFIYLFIIIKSVVWINFMMWMLGSHSRQPLNRLQLVDSA